MAHGDGAGDVAKAMEIDTDGKRSVPWGLVSDGQFCGGGLEVEFGSFLGPREKVLGLVGVGREG